MNAGAAEMTAGTSRGGAILVTILLAGLASEAAWEIWARVITPLWVGDPLERAAQVHSAFSLADRTTAEATHFLVGLLAYPFGYILIVQPIARRLVPFLPWWIVALGFGLALFAGLPPILGFITLTGASLIGHLMFGLTIGAVVQARTS